MGGKSSKNGSSPANRSPASSLAHYPIGADDGRALKALFTHISSLLSSAGGGGASSSSSLSLPLIPLDITTLIVDYTARRPLILVKRAEHVNHVTHIWRLPSPSLAVLQPTWQLLVGKEKTTDKGDPQDECYTMWASYGQTIDPATDHAKQATGEGKKSSTTTSSHDIDDDNKEEAKLTKPSAAATASSRAWSSGHALPFTPLIPAVDVLDVSNNVWHRRSGDVTTLTPPANMATWFDITAYKRLTFTIPHQRPLAGITCTLPGHIRGNGNGTRGDAYSIRNELVQYYVTVRSDAFTSDDERTYNSVPTPHNDSDYAGRINPGVCRVNDHCMVVAGGFNQSVRMLEAIWRPLSSVIAYDPAPYTPPPKSSSSASNSIDDALENLERLEMMSDGGDPPNSASLPDLRQANQGGSLVYIAGALYHWGGQYDFYHYKSADDAVEKQQRVERLPFNPHHYLPVTPANANSNETKKKKNGDPCAWQYVPSLTLPCVGRGQARDGNRMYLMGQPPTSQSSSIAASLDAAIAAIDLGLDGGDTIKTNTQPTKDKTPTTVTETVVVEPPPPTMMIWYADITGNESVSSSPSSSSSNGGSAWRPLCVVPPMIDGAKTDGRVALMVI